MTHIQLSTFIAAAPELCFDLARSVDVHQLAAKGTREKAIAGRLSGLCEQNDVITWEAVHFGIKQRLSVKITRLEYPTFFEDEMLSGAFSSMRHQHYFKPHEGGTIMTDEFHFSTPLGLLGRLAEVLFLKAYMRGFLRRRNSLLLEMAEKITMENKFSVPDNEY